MRGRLAIVLLTTIGVIAAYWTQPLASEQSVRIGVRNATARPVTVTLRSEIPTLRGEIVRPGGIWPSVVMVDAGRRATLAFVGSWDPYEPAAIGEVIVRTAGVREPYPIRPLDLLTFRDDACEIVIVGQPDAASPIDCVVDGDSPRNVSAYLWWLDHETAILGPGIVAVLAVILPGTWLLQRRAGNWLGASDRLGVVGITAVLWMLFVTAGSSPIATSPSLLRPLLLFLSIAGAGSIFLLPSRRYPSLATAVVGAGFVQLMFSSLAAMSVGLVISPDPGDDVLRYIVAVVIWLWLAVPGLCMVFAGLKGAREAVPRRPGWGDRQRA